MIGLIGIASAGIIGAIYFGNNMLVKESNKLVDLKASHQVFEDQEVGLNKAKRDIEKYNNLEDITQTIVPRDKDQARATREIVTLAAESGITIKTVTFPTSNLGNKVAAPSTQENSEAQPQQPANPISQAKPVQGINGVYSLEVNIVPSGTVNYYQFIGFLAKLEKNRRTAQVTRIKIEPKPSPANNPQLSFSLTINIFLKP